MSSYVGRKSNPGALVADGAIVLQRFDPARHAAVASRVDALKKAHAPYAAADARVDSAEKAEAAAGEQLAEKDAVRDAALHALDTQLIATGGPKSNSFKTFGCPAPAAIQRLGSQEETRVCKKLSKAVLAKKGLPAPVVSAAKALAKANDAVARAQATATAKEKASAEARVARNAYRHPLRAAMARLKLAVQGAEADGAVGLYRELFETEPGHAPAKAAQASPTMMPPPPPPPTPPGSEAMPTRQ